tara:strand:+ start:328 stop:1023 length:696 start_codon:yes stop_codon:yes gene_type:complete
MTTMFNYNYSKGMGVIYYPRKKIIRKFISGKKSLILLKNEYKGFNWYQSRCKFVFNKSNKIISHNKHYIDFPIYKGRQNKFWNYLADNLEDTEIVLDNYKKIWPKNKIVPCHGDLAFSNVIFRKNTFPIFIDWENFLYSCNWGLDLSYFLISTISLPSIFHKDAKILNSELILFENLWKKTFKNKNYKYLNKPVNFLKSRFGKIFKLRKYSDYYPNKLSDYKINQINEATQ